MNGHSVSLFLLLIFLVNIATAQSNFRSGYEKANPVPKQSTLELKEKMKVHEAFLNAAIQRKDSLQQLYGLSYLIGDQMRANNFPEASRYLLQAESLANASGNPVWQGWVAHRKGTLSLRLQDSRAAIVPYQQAVLLCRKGGDSLCVGESLEQIGAMYASLDDFEKAKPYFDQAIILIERYGNEIDLSIALNNVGTFYSRQDRSTEAIPYFERCVVLFKQEGMQKEEAQALNNLADAYRRLRQFDAAIKTYQRCIRLNTASKFQDNLLHNYMGLYTLYSDKGEYRTANEYLVKHYDLHDSILGAETMANMAELQVKYESQQKELALQKSQAELAVANASLERRNWFIFMGLLLVCFGIWRWIIQARRAKQKQQLHQQNLADLTRILLEKNTLLINMEENMVAQDTLSVPDNAPLDFETDLYNQHILTDSDWSAFKGYFEKAHPGYIQRLRSAFPTITNAEKRLFLLIKINLTTKEAAAMLGISADSVKKTRNRLRKRLGLSEEVDLDAFIKAF